MRVNISFSSPDAFAPILLQAWQAVCDLSTQQPLVQAKNLCLEMDVESNRIIAKISLPYPMRSREEGIKLQLQNALGSIQVQWPTDIGVDIRFTTCVKTHAVPVGNALLPGVKNIVAVASAKGGVGKSTTAVNLALALASEGARVGLLDADIYGPSVPILMGVRDREPEVIDNIRILPLENYGVKIMSMGLLVAEDKAVLWRAPMALKALDQLLRQTHWGTSPEHMIDYLIVDMPPGTGDIQLSMSQRVPLTAALIVTTPQDLALLDVQKGVLAFQKMGVPVLGMVENMAVHICSQCGHRELIFGADGGKALAQMHGLPYLGALPLALQIRQQSDMGVPVMVADPQGEIAQIYRNMAQQVAASIAALPQDHSHKFPPIRVEH